MARIVGVSSGGGGGGTGTVTSVALAMPAIFSVAGSPVTTAGTFTVTLANQAANLVFAGPAAGAAATPTFRALVAADLPAITTTTMWTRTGAVVALTNIGDQVGIGTGAPGANVKLQVVGTGAGSLGAIYTTVGDASLQHIVMDAGASAAAYLTFRGNAPAAMAMGVLFTAGTPTDYVFTDPSGDKMLGINVGARSLRFYENIAGGTNYVGLAAPAALAATTDYALPSAFPAANTDLLSGTTAGVMSWVANPALGDYTPAENKGFYLDYSLSADGKWSGIAIDSTAGAALAFGEVCYLSAADSRWELADASAMTTSGNVFLGMCVLAAAADGDPTRMLLFGTIRADAKFPALTISGPVVVSETAGEVTQTAPTTTDSVTRRLGFAITADSMFFNPSNDYYTHT